MRTKILGIAMLSLMPALGWGQAMGANPDADATLMWRMAVLPNDAVQAETLIDNLLTQQGFSPWGMTTVGEQRIALFMRGLPFYSFRSWTLESYPFPTGSSLTAFSQRLRNHWLPVSVTHYQGQLAVTMVQLEASSPPLVERWQLEPYAMADGALVSRLQTGISGYMAQGYVPMGLEAIDGTLWVLYLKFREPHTFTTWRLLPSVISEEALTSLMNDVLASGMLPVGLMVEDDQLYVLLLG